MKSVALVLFLVPCLCAQETGVEGIAINSITHQPLEGVHVTIYGLRTNAPPVESYGAMSGSDGHFSVTAMRPGKYGVRARHNGFFRSEKPNSALLLNPGERKSELLVEMTPEAVITGRVVDDAGDPAQAFVRAAPVSPGGDTFVLQFMYSQTDELGRFRIVGAPGKFYVSATIFVQGEPREIRTDGTEMPVYGETWFPGSDSKAHAVIVDAAGGRPTPNIDIHLIRRRSLTISGVVTGIPVIAADKPARAELVLSSKYNNQFFSTDAEGRFSLSGLAPDHYNLTARILTAKPPLFSQPVETSSETTDVDGINLRLVAGEEISGAVEIEGEAAKPGGSEKWTVGLEQLVPRNYVETQGGDVGRDGKFRIAPVYPGTLRVSVTPLPENAYIKAVQVDGGEPGLDVIDLSRGVVGSKVKIVIGRNGGQMEGTLLGAGEGGATIALVETVDDIGYRNTTYVPVGKRYRFTGLRPGKYRLIVASTGGLEPDGLQETFEEAPVVEVHQGDRITRDVGRPKEKPPANR
jgi:hypothetical protein